MDIVKKEGNHIVIKGIAQSMPAMRAAYVANILHTRMPRKFEKPDVKYYPLREWLAFRDDMKTVVAYTKIKADVAIFMNGVYIESVDELLVALKPHLTFRPDLIKFDEPVSEDHVQLLGISPKQSIIYFDLAKNDEPIGRVFYEIYSEGMPRLTKKFVQLCSTDPKSLRKKFAPEYSPSDESLINENILHQVFDADDPETIRDGKMDRMSYLGSYVTRIVPLCFIQIGKVAGIDDEWIDSELELDDLLPHASFGDISLASKPGLTKTSYLINLDQFIISLKPNLWMNGHYRCIGRLLHGRDVLEKVQDIPNYYGNPLMPVQIRDCGVIYSPFYNKPDEGMEGKELTALEPLQGVEDPDQVDEADQLDEANQVDELFLKNYKEVLHSYYNQLCEVQSSLHNNDPEKSVEFYYNLKDTLITPHPSEYYKSETDTDTDPVDYEGMEQMTSQHIAKSPCTMEIYKSVAQAEALALKLYKFLRPTTLEELLLEEKYLDAADITQHGFFLQCELYYGSSEDFKSCSWTDDSVEIKDMFEGEQIEEEVEEEVFGEGEGSEEFILEEQVEEAVYEELDSRESSPPAAPSIRSSVEKSGSPSLAKEDLLEEDLHEENANEEDVMDEMFLGEFEDLGEDGERHIRDISPDKYTLPDYVTPAYLLEMSYEPNLIPRQILEYIFESVIKPKSKVTLDGDVMNVMRSDNFQTALKSLPSKKLRKIAMQMEGVKQDLMEMDKYPQDEDALKKEDDVISSCISQFTQNMLDFYLRELYVNTKPGDYHITNSMLHIEEESPQRNSGKYEDFRKIKPDENSDSENGFDTDDTDYLFHSDAGKESISDDFVQEVDQKSNDTIETLQQSQTGEEVIQSKEESEKTYKRLDIMEDEELEQMIQTDSDINEEKELIPDELELTQDEEEFEY